MALVFAYGSNLDEGQMLRRCPSAELVCAATLPRHRLAFMGHSCGQGGAVATVMRAKRQRTFGLVWDIDRTDLRVLDGYEGVPFAYERRSMGVKPHLAGWGRGLLSVQVYIHQPAPLGKPSLRYLEKVARGYQRFGFPSGPLYAAVA